MLTRRMNVLSKSLMNKFISLMHMHIKCSFNQRTLCAYLESVGICWIVDAPGESHN